MDAHTPKGIAALERVRSAMAAARHETVDIQRIRPFGKQPRNFFDPKRMAELTESVRQSGQLVEGMLRPVNRDKLGRDFELIDGERRWRACLAAGVPSYRAMVVDLERDDTQFLISATVNFNRTEHTPQETALAIRHMHETLKLSLIEIGKLIGKHETGFVGRAKVARERQCGLPLYLVHEDSDCGQVRLHGEFVPRE